MKIYLVSLYLLLLVLVVGCDSLHGVQRTVVVDGNLPASNVVVVVRAMPQITGVEHATQPSRNVYTLYGRTVEPAYDQIIYHSRGSMGGVIETTPSSDDKTDLRLYRLSLGRLSDRQIEDVRRTMDAVYDALGKSFTNLPPAKAVKETIRK